MVDYGQKLDQVGCVLGGLVDLQSVKNAVDQKTRILFVETLSNPELIIPDLEELSKIAKQSLRNTVACLAPLNAYMLSLVLETLALRADRSFENTLKLARRRTNIQDNKTLAIAPYHTIYAEYTD